MAFEWTWLYGPPGVGKSSVGFELYSRLVAEGGSVGFVELDQIGMCMPAPAEVRAAAKADNLLAMLDNLRAARIEQVVVSGDIAGAAMDEVLRRSPTPPFLCRLRADHRVVVERLTIRGSPGFADASRTYDVDHVVPEGHLTLETDGKGIAELAREVRRAMQPSAPAADVSGVGREPPPPCPLPAVLLTGPRAVGKSTVAWQLHLAAMAGGTRSGYLDLEQLGFVQPPSAMRTLQAANLAACAAGLGRHGAQRLVLCGAADRALDTLPYRHLVPDLEVVALTARPETVLERARRRARRKEVWLPGDDLFGRTEHELAELAPRAAAFDGSGADLVIATDGRTVADVVATIVTWQAARGSSATT